MHSQNQQPEFDRYMNAVQRQQKVGYKQREQRSKTYQKCLRQYKQHLQNQTSQLEQSQEKALNKTNLIRLTYQKIYDDIYQDSDNTLRLIKKTFLKKKLFWIKTIQDFATSDDLELKKKFYEQKKVAQQNYQDSISNRRLITRTPYNKLVSLSDKHKSSLALFQQKNRRLEIDANLGTFLKGSHPEWQIDGMKFDDKQNSLKTWGQLNRQRTSEQQGQGIIRHFMKK